MNKFTFLTCIFLLWLGLQTSKAQQNLALTQQQEDFTIFRTSMQEMHAGLNWFITSERFKVLYDSVYNSLSDNTTNEQFYLKVRFCMAALKHGHGGVSMTNGENGINYKMGILPKAESICLSC
jgi:hypothetical protein